MKYLLSAICLVSLLGCEPECEQCEQCEDEIDPIVMEIVNAAKAGDVVEVDDSVGVEINGVFGFIPVVENRSALATCPALGLPSPEYDWFCEENNSNGRVVAKDETPDIDSFQVLDEYPSVAYPSPMTSRLFFSQTIYPNHWGGPVQAMRGQITAWGAGWGDAREARCASPVFADHCYQE